MLLENTSPSILKHILVNKFIPKIIGGGRKLFDAPRVIKRQITCPVEFTFGSSLIARNGILVTPRNHLERGN